MAIGGGEVGGLSGLGGVGGRPGKPPPGFLRQAACCPLAAPQGSPPAHNLPGRGRDSLNFSPNFTQIELYLALFKFYAMQPLFS